VKNFAISKQLMKSSEELHVSLRYYASSRKAVT